MARPQVLLISRLSTQNAGNEALSKELIKYAKASLLEADVRAFDRYPRYFEQFTLRNVKHDPVQAFDNLARRLTAENSTADAVPAPLASVDLVKLDQTARELTGPLRKLKRKIAFRQRLARFGLIEKDKLKSGVSAAARSDLLIWNPAGEIHPTGSADQVMRLLLLLRIAQLQGKRTAIINHSLEIEDPVLRALIQHVYKAADYVGVRDAKSVEVARSLGVPDEKIHESPDLVFLAARSSVPPETIQVEKGAIGLAINGLESLRGTDEWTRLMAELSKLGRQFLLLSNAVNHDLVFSKHLQSISRNAVVVDHQPGYESLRSYYRQCDVLISSRLHASIVSLCEHTPVVSIEPSVFKLTAIFQQMNYPISTVRLQDAGWADRVIESVKKALSAERPSLIAEGDEALIRQTDRIDKAFAPLFAFIKS